MSPAQRRKRAMARAQVTVSGYPSRGDLHNRDAIRNMIDAADMRGEAIRVADHDPARACQLRKTARKFLASAAKCSALAVSYGFHLPTGA